MSVRTSLDQLDDVELAGRASAWWRAVSLSCTLLRVASGECRSVGPSYAQLNDKSNDSFSLPERRNRVGAGRLRCRHRLADDAHHHDMTVSRHVGNFVLVCATRRMTVSFAHDRGVAGLSSPSGSSISRNRRRPRSARRSLHPAEPAIAAPTAFRGPDLTAPQIPARSIRDKPTRGTRAPARRPCEAPPRCPLPARRLVRGIDYLSARSAWSGLCTANV